jgi:micrococcal nuclease
MKTLKTGVFSLVLLIVCAASVFPWQSEVKDVVDGDTIKALQYGDIVSIRLYGIDAPEMNQPFGKESRDRLASLLSGRTFDVEVIDKDNFGRLIAIITTPHGCVNERLIKDGCAWVYKQYCKHPDCKKWADYESRSRSEKKGLWSQNNAIEPWVFRSNKSQDAPNASDAPAKEEAATSDNYHGNVTSYIFHRSSCRYFRCKACTKIFSTREEAINAGFRPCKVCNP